MDISNILKDDGIFEVKIPETEVTIKLRTLRPKEVRDVRSAATFYEERGRQLLARQDEDAFDFALVKASVIGWSGIELDGKPLEFSSENLKVLFENWFAFGKAVLEAALVSMRAEESKRKALEKNSPSGPATP